MEHSRPKAGDAFTQTRPAFRVSTGHHVEHLRRVQGLVYGLGFTSVGYRSSGFRSLGFRVWGLGFGV